MKLHLPKKLFTALLAAITLAAPATLTLGSVAQGDDATHWDITSSAYTSTETTITDGTTIYLGNGTGDGSGSGDADTKFESGKFTIENGGKLYIHGWTSKNLTINADPKLEIASEIELQSGGTLHMQDGSYYFSKTVAVSGTVNIKSQWDKGHVFNALTGNASSIINMSGHNSWATTFALQGEGGYAGRINLTGGSSGGKTVLAINSASALASTAAINLSGQYTNLAMNTASQTLSSIAGNGTIMLANTTILGGTASSSELTISNTAASSDVFSGTIDSGITVKVADGSYQTFGGVTNNGTLTFEKGSNVTLNKTITGTGTVNLNGAVTIGSLDGFQYEVLDGTLNGEGGDHGFRTGNVQYSLVAGANTTDTDFSVTLGGTDITDKLRKTDNALEYVLSTTRTIYEILDTHTETVVYDGVNGESATATGFELASGTTLQLNSDLAGTVTDGISIADSATATIKVVKTGETTPSLSSSSVKLGTSSAVDYVVDGGTLDLYSGSGTNSLRVTNNGVVNVNGANHVLGSTDKRVLVVLGEGGNISFINGGGGGAAHMDVTVTGTGILTGSWQGDHLNVQGTITGEQGSTLQLAQRSGSTNTWTISSAISGNLAVTSNALVTLSGTNTYTGGTVITNGHLCTDNTSALGTGAVELNNSGVLRVFNALTISELNSTSATTVVTTGTGAATLTVSAGEFAGALKDFVAHSNFKGVAEGAHALSLVKTGSGTLTLSGANTYTGSTTVSGGSLILAGSSTLGTGLITLESGTELELQSTGNTIANSITGAGTLVIANGGNATVDSNTLGGTKINTNIRIEDGGTLTFTSSGSDNLNYGNNSRTIYLEGNAKLDFGASRQTMGFWTVDMTGGVVSGTNSTASLDFHNSASLKAHAAKNASAENPTISSISANIRSKDGGTLSVTVDENAQLNMSGQLTLNRPTEKLGAGKLLVNGGTGITQNISGEFTISAGSVEFNGASISVGTFNNNAALTVSGGTANMNGTVTNNGTITVSGGTATFANTLSMEGTGAALTVSGGTANVNGSFNVTGTDVVVSQSGDGVLNLGGGVTINEGAAATFNGQVGIGSTITNNGTLTLNDSITIIGELSAFTQRGEATESYQLADGTSGGNNGFRVISGASYWLTSEGSTGTTSVAEGITTVQHGGNSYNLNQDDGGEGEGSTNNWYFQVESNVGKVYYVTSGNVVVNNTVQTKATGGYVLQGGNMQLTQGQVSTSAMSYTSGTITLSDGAVLVLDSESGSLTAQNLLTGILSASPSSEGGTPTGKLQIKQGVSLGNNTTATYTGVVELVNATLTAGSGPGNSVNISAISEFILNGTSEIYYHANPSADTDIQKITVESGTGSLYLRDSNNEPMTVGSVDIAAGATFKFWSNWHDSALTVESLTGQGTFRAESSDSSAMNPNVTVSSLKGFEGNLDFVKDSDASLNVLVSTGTDAAVSFNSLTTKNSNGEMDFDFNVQTDTTVGTINVTGTNNTINIASTGTLHAFTKAGEGTITLTGSGKYALGNSNTLTSGVTLADTWEGTLVYSYAAKNNDITTNVTNLAGLKTSDKAVQISGTIGYLNAETNNALGVDIVLENPTDGYALTIANGNSNMTAIISGAVSGTGDIAFNPQYYSTAKWSWENVKYQFSGNIAGWTGNFIFQNTTTDANDVLTVIFRDNATSIHANLINNNMVDADNGISSANTSDKFNLEITNTQKVDVYGTVDVDKVTVTNTGETNFHSSLKAATVELGTAATITGKDGGTVTMSKAAMSTTGISSSTDDGSKGTISNADVAIAQLAQDASFTIEDMTLTNTTITAATPTTQVKLQNVTASNVVLAKGKFTMGETAQVSMGGAGTTGNDFTTSSLSGITLQNSVADGVSSSTLVVDLGDLSCVTAMGPGKYDLSITLSGFTMQDYTQGIVFAADSWLGQLLTAQGATAYVSGAVETPASVSEGGTGGVSVSYSAATGGNVGTVITINGLNVPEPATSTLSLLALAALAARRRRKA